MIEILTDDKIIIKRMKKTAGLHDKILASVKQGRDSAFVNGDELFYWFGGTGDGVDTGYMYFRSNNPIELLEITARLLGGVKP